MNKEYYEKNKAAIIQNVTSWQKRNPELVRRAKTKSRNKVRLEKPYRLALYGAKARAAKHSIQFDLTEEWALERWTGKCELTGAPFDLSPGGKTKAFSLSLDRNDSSKGYTKENCRFIIWAVNRFKSDYDDETMMKIARLLVAC